MRSRSRWTGCPDSRGAGARWPCRTPTATAATTSSPWPARWHGRVSRWRRRETSGGGVPSGLFLLFGDEGHARVTGAADFGGDFHHPAIGHVGVGIEIDLLVIAFADDGGELGGEIGRIDLRRLDEDRAIGAHPERERGVVGFGFQRGGRGLRQAMT